MDQVGNNRARTNRPVPGLNLVFISIYLAGKYYSIKMLLTLVELLVRIKWRSF